MGLDVPAAHPVCFRMVHCDGCGRDFSLSGYDHHLKLTTNRACAELYREIHGFLPLGMPALVCTRTTILIFVSIDDSLDGDEDVSMPLDHRSDGEDDDAVDEPMPFAGDFFGEDYVEADFDWVGNEPGAADIWNTDGMVSCQGHQFFLTVMSFPDESSDSGEENDYVPFAPSLSVCLLSFLPWGGD